MYIYTEIEISHPFSIAGWLDSILRCLKSEFGNAKSFSKAFSHGIYHLHITYHVVYIPFKHISICNFHTQLNDICRLNLPLTRPRFQ